MIKCCKNCKHIYCADDQDVSGLNCEKHRIIKIVCPEEMHPMCTEFKFSLYNFLMER